jgi:transposase InsO family protein
MFLQTYETQIAFFITIVSFRYCTVMTDHFSGFCWAKTFPDKAADNLVTWAFDIIMNGFGCPDIVLSDNGKDVTNKLTKSKIIKLQLFIFFKKTLYRIMGSIKSFR